MKTKGKCVGCQGIYSTTGASKHVFSCSKIAQILRINATPTAGYFLKVSSKEMPSIYWMLLAISAHGTLSLLDYFLRDTWVECCDHLSMFTIGGDSYSSYPEGEDLSMKKRVDKVFRPGMYVDYVYDFGSSTNLKIKVMAVLDNCPKEQITLLMRNKPPLFKCKSCKKKATVICSFCGETVCSSCDKQHACAKEEEDTYMLMPIVSSPRTGVCGYGDN